MSADSWDTTDLGKQGGETFSADYDPRRGVVRLSGTGVEPQEFAVDAGQWEQQAARELAARGYGNRWTQWEPGPDGTRVMSTARTRYPDADPGRPSSASAAATPAPAAELGRVRVYPSYTFPVYQYGGAGSGMVENEITVTDWHKQGRVWAEGEARRQVSEALGGPPNAEGPVGGPWSLGAAKKDSFRWHPVKGTPRDQLPEQAASQAAWEPDNEAIAPDSLRINRDLVGKELFGDNYDPNDSLPPEQRTYGTPARSGTETETETGTAGETVPRHVQEARDRTQRLHNEQVARDEAAVRADAAADSPDPTVLANGTEITPAERRRLVAEAEGRVAERRRVVAEAEAADRRQTEEVLGRVDDFLDRRRGASEADLEDRRPPAEQAERYAARRGHYDEQHGPGKRGKKGWTAHKRGCEVCSDIDSGGDGTGRQLRSVAPPAPTPAAEPAAAASAPAADPYPVRFTFTGGGGAGAGGDNEIRHWRWDAAMDALQDQVAAWTIPEDGTGVLDTDSFIASIGGYVGGVGAVLGQLAEELGGGQTPIAAVVGEALADFASSLAAMADEAGTVYQQWAENDDNAHDLRRARGEVKGAHLFNVG